MALQLVDFILLTVIGVKLSFSESYDQCSGFCAAPWKKWAESCYLIIDRPLSYDDARQTCRKLGAKMAAPRSDQENDFMASLAPGSTIWVACTDRRQEGDWECDGWQNEGGSYINWSDGDPNNSDSNENCASLIPESLKWNDVVCAHTFFAVCKRPSAGSCFTINLDGRLDTDSCL